MATLISCLIIGLAIFVSIPTAVVLIEVVAAIMLPTRTRAPLPHKRARVAVVVPAHNEGGGLVPTLNDVKADLILGDRLLVVADNCADDTAAIAAAAGAEVVVRNDPKRIGKGYALDWGVRCLFADPPEILIVVDADCRGIGGRNRSSGGDLRGHRSARTSALSGNGASFARDRHELCIKVTAA